MDDCRMITTELLDPRTDYIERNPKPTEESKVKEVRFIGNSDHKSVGIGKNLLADFKQKLIELL